MNHRELTIDEELKLLQYETFSYILHKANPANGLVIDISADTWSASIATVGLALSACPVGVERDYITHAAVAERSLVILNQVLPATGYKTDRPTVGTQR